MRYPSRKGVDDPEGETEMGRTTTASTGPEVTGPGDKAVLCSEGRYAATSGMRLPPARASRAAAKHCMLRGGTADLMHPEQGTSRRGLLLSLKISWNLSCLGPVSLLSKFTLLEWELYPSILYLSHIIIGKNKICLVSQVHRHKGILVQDISYL